MYIFPVSVDSLLIVNAINVIKKIEKHWLFLVSSYIIEIGAFNTCSFLNTHKKITYRLVAKSLSFLRENLLLHTIEEKIDIIIFFPVFHC